MFRTQYNHFEYQIMSFELINASVIFQIYINKTLKSLMNVTCVIYLNNILIFSDKSANYKYYVQQIFERFKNYELYINLKKCEFNINKIKFLNFIVFTKEIEINLKQI